MTKAIPTTLAVTALVALLLAAATAVFFGASWRFTVIEPQLIDNLSLDQQSHPWRIIGNVTRAAPSSKATLSAPRSRLGDDVAPLRLAAIPLSQIARSVPRPAGIDHVRVTLDARTQNLGGDEIWHGGVTHLIGFDERRAAKPHWPSQVTHLVGDNEWVRVSLVLPVSDDAKGFYFSVYSAGTTGSLHVKNIQLEGLAETKFSEAVRGGLAIGWLALWLWLFFVWAKQIPRRTMRLIAFLGANVLLVAGVAPQPQLNDTLKMLFFRGQDAVIASGQVINSVAETVSSLTRQFGSDDAPDSADNTLASAQSDVRGEVRGSPSSEPARREARRPPASSPVQRTEGRRPLGAEQRAPPPRSYWLPSWDDFDKVEHVGSFAVLALLVGFAYPRRSWGIRAAALVVFATSIQALQHFTVTREPDISDLRSDSIGILIGTLLFAGIAFVSTHYRARRAAPASSA